MHGNTNLIGAAQAGWETGQVSFPSAGANAKTICPGRKKSGALHHSFSRNNTPPGGAAAPYAQ